MKLKHLSRRNKSLFYKMMWQFIPFLLLAPALVSCGGAGGDVLAGGGIGGTGNTSVGPITALGSIFVNGIEFRTTNAAVTLDGVDSNEKALQVGMVVKVDGTIDADGRTGQADLVTFHNNAAGPIKSIDLAESTLEVMGQTVIVDTQTIIAGLRGPTQGLAGLTANDLVEISGLADADGNVMATRIALKTSGTQSQVTGKVSGLSAAVFRINALTVDYSKAALNKFDPVGIQIGDIVDVTGNLTPSGTLLADVVERKSNNCADNSSTKFQGFIGTLDYSGQSVSGFVIITQFGLQRVALDASTVFSGGAPVRVGARVQVEGTVKNNIIQARKVDLLGNSPGKGGPMMNPLSN